MMHRGDTFVFIRFETQEELFSYIFFSVPTYVRLCFANFFTSSINENQLSAEMFLSVPDIGGIKATRPS